jgi:hypothetical protein
MLYGRRGARRPLVANAAPLAALVVGRHPHLHEWSNMVVISCLPASLLLIHHRTYGKGTLLRTV